MRRVAAGSIVSDKWDISGSEWFAVREKDISDYGKERGRKISGAFGEYPGYEGMPGGRICDAPEGQSFLSSCVPYGSEYVLGSVTGVHRSDLAMGLR